MTATPNPDWNQWEHRFEQFLLHHAPSFDAAHDLVHIRRVVATAKTLAQAENADLAVVLPAAWLHDCVVVAKNSPLRPTASSRAAQVAIDFLSTVHYPKTYLPAIRHAIEAHSFSANIPPRTLEAQVVQDADRLDALGAIGIARCLMLGGESGKRLYDPHEPFPLHRPPDDTINTIDHFYTKLLRLAGSMTTKAGRAEADRRTVFMQQFLAQLHHELAASLYYHNFGTNMNDLKLHQTETITKNGETVRVVYYDEAEDILEVFFGDNEPVTGVELTDHILLRLNQTTGRAVSLTLLHFSILAERTEYGPRSYPLNNLKDLPEVLRDLVFRVLTTPPVDEFLKLSYFQASPTKRVPFTYVEPSLAVAA